MKFVQNLFSEGQKGTFKEVILGGPEGDLLKVLWGSGWGWGSKMPRFSSIIQFFTKIYKILKSYVWNVKKGTPFEHQKIIFFF